MNNIETVVNNNFCVGCGACAVVSNTKMKINDYGEYLPDLDEINFADKNIEESCPFLKPALNEDFLANEFLDGKNEKSDKIGFYSKVYAGFVEEENFRKNGTSGGSGTWVGHELMRLGKIDAVIHVKESKRDESFEPFYKYDISNNLDEVISGSKSKYHVVEISEIINYVKENEGIYLFIGVPCLVKSVRRLQLKDEILRTRIKYTVALVCGHFKSINWTLSLAWAKGIQPKELDHFQYRTKGDNIPARKYVFRAKKNNPEKTIIQEDSSNVVGGKFNQGAMMLSACNFCDDVVGETADMTVGDAWLPQFEADDNGTNLLIFRNKELLNIFENANTESRVKLTEISEKDAVNSQSGGFRQRREGLSHRLLMLKKQNKWFPEKRILPGQFKVSWLRKKIYDMRVDVSLTSREVFKEALESKDYNKYAIQMTNKFDKLRKWEITSVLFKASINKLSRIYQKLK